MTCHWHEGVTKLSGNSRKQGLNLICWGWSCWTKSPPSFLPVGFPLITETVKLYNWQKKFSRNINVKFCISNSLKSPNIGQNSELSRGYFQFLDFWWSHLQTEIAKTENRTKKYLTQLSYHYSLFHMKITVSVTKSSHEDRGLCYLHLKIFFL